MGHFHALLGFWCLLWRRSRRSRPRPAWRSDQVRARCPRRSGYLRRLHVSATSPPLGAPRKQERGKKTPGAANRGAGWPLRAGRERSARRRGGREVRAGEEGARERRAGAGGGDPGRARGGAGGAGSRSPGAGGRPARRGPAREDAAVPGGQLVRAPGGAAPLGLVLRPAGARLPALPGLRRRGLLVRGAAVRGPAAPGAAQAQAALPGAARVPVGGAARALPGPRAGGQQLRRVGAGQRLGQLELGLHLRALLRQHGALHHRLWPHGALVGRGQGLLHHLLHHRHPLHPALPDGRGPARHHPRDPPARALRAPALGLLEAAGGPGPRCAAGRGHRVLLLLHPGRRVLGAGGRLELPGVLLLLLHLPEHHWPGRLRPGGGLQPEVPGALQAGHHLLPAARPGGHAGGAGNLLRAARAEEVPQDVLREKGQGRGPGAHHGARPAVLLLHHGPGGRREGGPEAGRALCGPGAARPRRRPPTALSAGLVLPHRVGRG